MFETDSNPRTAPIRIVIMDQFANIYADNIRGIFPEIEISTASNPQEALPLMAEARALFALAPFITNDMIAAAPHLEWVQALTSGVDTFAKLPALSGDVTLCSARGIHGPQVAEMGIMLMLTLGRDLPKMMRNQRDHVWERWPQRLLWNRTVTIVGIGTIAEALAGLCRAFGMRVLGVSSTAREVPGFDTVYAKKDMGIPFAESDYIVLLSPYSAETHNMIDGAAFAAMSPEAYLINLARGGIVDENALVDALRTKAIKGAAFDVFSAEPLPPDHPLWDEPNLLVTPHIAGMSDCYEFQVLPIIEHNIRCFLSGARGEMCNLVDRRELMKA